jgi:pimeloyl-ACP methyl ester carboxylesterase
VPPALEPAGGWAPGDDAPQRLLDSRPRCAQARAAAPHAAAILATAEGRRRATQYLTTNLEHIPADLLAHLLLGVAACRAPELIDRARALSWDVDAERITSPVRIVWGTADRLLPWPSAAVRYRMEWLPHADWVEVEGVGHAPQLDVPLETAQLILGFTAP